jgi:hypothetical protein
MPSHTNTAMGSTRGTTTYEVGSVQVQVSEHPMNTVSSIDGSERFPGGRRPASYTFYRAAIVSGGPAGLVAYGQSEPEAVFEALHMLAIEVNGQASDERLAARVAEAVREALAAGGGERVSPPSETDGHLRARAMDLADAR